MNYLFLHQNYPGQFARLAEALAPKNVVVAIGAGDRSESQTGPVKYRSYRQYVSALEPAFPPLEHLSEQVRRGRAVADVMRGLKSDGFQPDVVVAHPGWGEAMFVRDVFPDAALVAYLEYYYWSSGTDLDFDPEFPAPVADLPYVRFRNIANVMAFETADLCLTATEWQAATFPPNLRTSLTVLHDGVDTKTCVPDPAARFRMPNGRELTRADEVVTFVARSLEPYRGFHVFLRALPDLLRRRPGVTVLVVGGDDVSYGRGPRGGGTWRQALLDEVGEALDPNRVIFLGRLPYGEYRRVLQVSSVHVYLTYPFVLSWSLIEAMATGCALVASATGPVTEVVTDRENGRLFDFFDGPGMVALVEELLEDPAQRARLGVGARETAVARYDFRTRILPRQLRLFGKLSASRS